MWLHTEKVGCLSYQAQYTSGIWSCLPSSREREEERVSECKGRKWERRGNKDGGGKENEWKSAWKNEQCRQVIEWRQARWWRCTLAEATVGWVPEASVLSQSSGHFSVSHSPLLCSFTTLWKLKKSLVRRDLARVSNMAAFSYYDDNMSAQSCLTFCDLMGYSPPDSSLPVEFSKEESWIGMPGPPGDLPHPGIEPASFGRWILYHWVTWELFFLKIFKWWLQFLKCMFELQHFRQKRT